MSDAITRIVLRTVVVAVAALAIHRFVILPWRAHRILSAVEARTAAAADAGDTNAVLMARRDIELLDQTASVTRTDPNFYMLYAFNERILGNPAGAAAKYTEALQYADHRPEIYFGRGQAYLAQGNIEAAEADLVHAARFNPSIVKEISGELKDRVTREAGNR
jgi:tetratricopeptide (TPR) repeat protein